MVEGALDFVIMVFVVAACLSVCMGLMVPMVKESKQLVYDEVYNKSVDRLDGDRVLTNPEVCVPAGKISLCGMGQKSFMPEPRKISIPRGKNRPVDMPVDIIDVGDTGATGDDEGGYAARRKDIGERIYRDIEEWFGDFTSGPSYSNLVNPPESLQTSSKIVNGEEINTTALFTFMYDTNRTEDKADDSFALYIKVTENKPFAEPQLYKCLPGGKLQSKEGNIV